MCEQLVAAVDHEQSVRRGTLLRVGQPPQPGPSLASQSNVVRGAVPGVTELGGSKKSCNGPSFSKLGPPRSPRTRPPPLPGEVSAVRQKGKEVERSDKKGVEGPVMQFFAPSRP